MTLIFIKVVLKQILYSDECLKPLPPTPFSIVFKKVRLFLVLVCLKGEKWRIFLVIYCKNSIGKFVDSKGTNKIFHSSFVPNSRESYIQQNQTITQPGLAPNLSWIYLCQWYLATMIIDNAFFSRWLQKCSIIIPLLHTGKQTHIDILTLTHSIPKIMWIASYPRSLLYSLSLSSRYWKIYTNLGIKMKWHTH